MATATKQTSKTTTTNSTGVHPLVAKQQEKIALFNQETATMHDLAEAYQAALAKDDSKLTAADKKIIAEYRSASARKANRSKEIGQLELDMRLANRAGGEQIEFTKFEAPKNGSNGNAKRPSISKEQLVTDLEQVGAIYNDPETEDSVKHDCDVRIGTLLRLAKTNGYEVTDPRVTA